MKLTKSPIAWLVLLLVAMPVVSVAVLALSGNFETRELPVLGQVPEFVLTERAGRKVGLSDLKGKVWVAGFLYTGCPTECPLMTAKMQRVQRKFRLKDRFRLVAITSDPAHDTVEVLRDYALRADADPFKWFFLTGDRRAILDLSEKGFRLAMDETDPSVHSLKFVLVDHLGRIRGYYDSMDDKAVDSLIKDTRGLIRQAF